MWRHATLNTGYGDKEGEISLLGQAISEDIDAMSDFDSNPFADPDFSNPFQVCS